MRLQKWPALLREARDLRQAATSLCRWTSQIAIALSYKGEVATIRAMLELLVCTPPVALLRIGQAKG